MAEKKNAAKKATDKKRQNIWVNVSLVFAFGLVAVLLYAFVMRGVNPRIDPTRDENPGALLGDVIQIEVRNGCGISGLAADMTTFLRQRGFDVVEMGDYDTFDMEYTMVYDRAGNREAAQRLAAALGLPKDRVIQELRPEFYLDASLVIGKDYKRFKPFAE